MSGLIHHLSISQSHVFLLNSRLGHFSAPHLREDPLSRSYRVNLPNSLAMTHSSTFGYSPRPPVSVCGTGGARLKLSGFSRELPIASVTPAEASVYSRRSPDTRCFTRVPSAHGFNQPFRRLAGASHLRPRVAARAGTVLLNRHPSAAPPPKRDRLRTRLTLIRLALIRNPWTSGVRVSHPHCRYLCLHLPFRTLQPASRRTFGAVRNAPLPIHLSRGFGGVLDARSSSIPDRSTSELLRTL